MDDRQRNGIEDLCASVAPVLLVHHDRAFATGVLDALALGPMVVHVETSANARAAIMRAMPKLVITADSLPDGSGIDLIGWLRRGSPAGWWPHAVVCARCGSAQLSAHAALVRAQYLERSPSDECAEHLVEALRALIAWALEATRDTENWKRAIATDLAAQCKLTPRQAQVLDLIAQGVESRREIAAEVGIEVSSLKNHLDELFDKLERRTRVRSVRGIRDWITEHALYLAVTSR